MEKLKHVLSGHRKSEDTSHSHESPTSSSAAEGQSHPIFDEMTGSKKGREGTLTASGGPYAQVKTTSGEPYSTLARPDSEMHGKLEQVGPSAPLATAGTTHGEPTIGSTTSGRPIDSSTTTSTNPTSSSPLTSTNPTTSSTTKSTDPTIGSTATSGNTLRPNANLSSKNSVNTALSEASIKSGVIGFGVGEHQEHAALPNRTFPDDHLDRSQAVTSSDPIGAGRAEQSNLPSSSTTQPQTHPTTVSHERADPNVQGVAARQPHESALRKESYTADTDRSFPLAGGVARKSHEHSDPTHHKSISEREPGTKEKGVGVKESHGREGLAGAAALATAVGASKAAHHSDEDQVEKRGLGSDNIASGHTPLGTSQQSQPSNTTTGFVGSNTGPLGRTTADPAGTTATAPLGNTSSSTSKGLVGDNTSASTASGPLSTTTSGPLGTTSGPTANTTGPLGNTTNAPLGTTSTNPASSKTQQHNPLALAAATAAATAAASKSSPSAQDAGHNAQGRSLAEPAQPTASAGLTSNTSDTRPTLGSCPHGTRSASHRHIPGEFPSPTPGDESRTFLDYRSGVEPVEGSTIAPQATSGQHESTIAPGPTSGQHELRHTGSLDQPASKSDAEHHYGRDAAALAGGVGAGAALGSLASSRKQETADTNSKPLYEEENPYSSKALDPRVTGENASALESQRFDPQAKTEASPHVLGQTSNTTGVSDVTAPAAPLASQTQTEASPHHLSQTSDTTDLSSATGPTASHGVVESEASQHHYGRDAALVGAGAATAGGLRHELQRNDTPGTGTSVLPQDSSAPVSSTTAPHHPTSTSGTAPTSGNNTFFGTSGAPAPLVDTSSQQKQQQPLGNLGHTTEPTASQTSPHVPAKESEHHYGRDAAIVGAGAATTGGLYAATRDDKTDTGPASKTIGPHSSNVANIVDPRVQPDFEKQKTSTTTGPYKSDTLNRLDPRVEEKAGQKSEHHLGRDAAVAGGTGAAGYGAYEAAKSYDDHRSTQPGASMTEQRYDTTAPGATTSNPVPTKGQYDYNDPNTTCNVNRSSNLGTGAALGAGAGLGAAAYTSSKHADNTQNIPLHQQQDFASSAAPGPVTQGTTAPRDTHDQAAGHQRYDSTQEPKKDHDLRNAALLGTAGAAAAGGAAYGYNQHQDAERARLEKEQQERLKKEAHDREKEQHRLDKEHHKQEKEAHKLEKEQHKHDKEIAAAQHKHDKEVRAYEKEQKQHDKDLAAQEKEQRKLDKAAEKEAQHEGEGEGEKKHRLFGFLHRDKSKKEKSTTSQESSPRQSRDYTAATAGTVAAAAGTGGVLAASRTSSSGDEHDPSSPRWKGKNKLHKDPPKGHPAREALEHQQLGAGAQTHDVPGAKREHIGVDGPIGHADQISGDRETRKGVFGAHDFADSTTQEHTVVEPRTGLPMNVEKYGAGTGGTDGNPAIEGFRGDATAAGTGPTGTGFGTTTGTGVGHGTGADRPAGY